MSGGSYDYFFDKLNTVASDIRPVGNCSCAPPHVRKAFVAHLLLVAEAMKAVEWNDSCDGDPDEERLIRALLGNGAPMECLLEQANETAKLLRAEIEFANRGSP